MFFFADSAAPFISRFLIGTDLGLYAFPYYLTRFSAETSLPTKFAVREFIHALGPISEAPMFILVQTTINR